MCGIFVGEYFMEYFIGFTTRLLALFVDMKRSGGYIVWTLLFAAAPLVAQPGVVVEGEYVFEPVRDRYEYFVDRTTQLSFADIQRDSVQGLFLRGKVNVANFGISASAIWLKTRVSNRNHFPIYLQLPNPLFADIHVFLPQEDGSYREMQHQGIADTNSRTQLYHIFPLPEMYPDGTEQVVYIRVASANTLLVPLVFGTQLGFNRKENLQIVVTTSLFGVLLVMIVYNAFIGFSVRDKSYLYYALYGITAMLTIMHQNGFLLLFWQYLFPHAPAFWREYLATNALLTIICALLFGQEFLNLRETMPKARVFIRYSIALCVAMIAGEFCGRQAMLFVHQVFPIAAIICIICLLSIAILLVRRGFRAARFYVLAWSMWLVCVITLALMARNFIPATPIIEYLTHIAVTCEIVLMSFALADKISVLQGANQTLMQEHSEVLEREVHERTLELEASNAALQSTNMELTALSAENRELISIVAHDLRNPLTAIIGVTEALINDTSMVNPEGASFVERIGLSAEQMVNIVNRLLEIDRLESGALEPHPELCNPVLIIETVVNTYMLQAAKKFITLHTSNEGVLTVFADSYMLYQILDNLVSNAIKYSPHRKNIFVRIASLDHQIRIEVQDEGPGLNEDDKKKLFGKFTRLSARPTGGEHSTGLGLNIVKRMIEVMNGKVWCESDLGKGATFIVELPSTEKGIPL